MVKNMHTQKADEVYSALPLSFYKTESASVLRTAPPEVLIQCTYL